ncbi:uncharacterized protein V6R79_015483 [Siganus canaliculatus]
MNRKRPIFFVMSQNRPSYRRNPSRPLPFPKQNTTEESLQINENMRLHPVGFVALFSKSGIIIFYRQQERHILNRNSAPNFKLKLQEQASDE